MNIITKEIIPSKIDPQYFIVVYQLNCFYRFINMQIKCYLCVGLGRRYKYVVNKCQTCHGRKIIYHTDHNGNLFPIDCSSCYGTGTYHEPKLALHRCEKCKGTGSIYMGTLEIFKYMLDL